MSNEDTTIAPVGTDPDRIDLQSDTSVADWAKKLDVTEMQLKEAVAAAGDRATDIEMHLTGSRSMTNAKRIDETGRPRRA